jgi:hypothetical protein
MTVTITPRLNPLNPVPSLSLPISGHRHPGLLSVLVRGHKIIGESVVVVVVVVREMILQIIRSVLSSLSASIVLFRARPRTRLKKSMLNSDMFLIPRQP